ncbi:MAG: [protein-PII] uridylyltransferase [Gammaproteobacteria bacterium]|nr:[protein-PII] uridylyltransferase [Gammaproteobacteria bacterium]
MAIQDSSTAINVLERYEAWFGTHALDAELAPTGSPVPAFKKFLEHSQTTLKQKFEDGVGAPTLIAARSWLVDQVLARAWDRFMGANAGSASFVAVGGYGRGELMPGSDIDLMILLPESHGEQFNSQLESLLIFLWDIGLEVGHSVRTISECVEQSLADITVITNLMEARLLAGNATLFREMRASVAPDKIWNSTDFFKEKHAEQIRRYHKYHDTAYNLEPNVKGSPGGLRDIQMIAWVTNRQFGSGLLEDLVSHGFLTEDEYHTLVEGRNFLWEIRFALHTLTGRGEDRLLFDYQRTLAEQFGYHDQEDRLGVEAFMKQYYRTVMELSRLNEMLLQLFQEEILFPGGAGESVRINKRFQARNGYLEVADANVFQNYPFALLEIFLLLEQNPELKGIRADTVRAIRKHCHRIDEKFRDDIRARSLFMEIIKQPIGVTHVLRRMNMYGILAAYIPAFERITGLMQYDLFHAYTVDEHILFVVRNMRRLTLPEFSDELPLCSRIISTIPKPELLYLAGLFHDIGKGRGGDHSTLGAEDARDFCQKHHLSSYDTRLVAWLVENHLTMSSVAQREDISDPVVVNRFARLVEDPVRLDYLYLLTVCDIRGTNPNLWNNWKNTLLSQLYYSTRRALQRGLQDPLERAEHIQQVQQEARRLLRSIAPPVERPDEVWQNLDEEYFQRHTPDQVAWHTRLLAGLQDADACIVSVQPVTERGSTEIFIYARASDELFTLITAVLDQLGLDVVDAGIITTHDGHVLNTFHVLEASGEPAGDDLRVDEIHTALLREIENGGRDEWHVSRRTPREYRHFPIQTHIEFKRDETNSRTIMELITSDHPGLLSQVGKAFGECKVRLLNAKIITLGSRAEDIFYITDRNNRPIEDAGQIECLEKALHKHLDSKQGGAPALFR